MAGNSLTLAELAQAVATASAGRLTAEIVGPAQDLRIAGAAPLSSAGASDLSFLANPKYRTDAAATAAGAVVMSVADRAALYGDAEPTRALVITRNPYAWFAFALQCLHPAERAMGGIHPAATVDSSAQIHASARIDAGAVVERDAVVGAGAWIGANCVVGHGSEIGAATRLHPNVSVAHGCRIGRDGIIHSGTVIGADGFGFAPFEGRWIKIPQVGGVLIGDDVEIGANCSIDRGALGDTVIEEGAKLDNQIQVAHNCRIGARTVIAGCVGIAGSATIGRGCQIGGAAMIAGHLTIADGCAIGPGTLVASSITEAGHYTGFFPMMKNREWERSAAIIRHLDDMRRRVRALEAQGKPI
ncbi:MAG: UDP-3-O-(3-hydroxymyristoyl)glucosamine N-acyltransferase [Burkholderiaceae bacterium]